MFRARTYIACCVVAALLSGCEEHAPTDDEASRTVRVAATVNQQEITAEQLQARFERLRGNRSLTPEQALRLKATALRALIDEALIEQAAQTRNIDISDKAVDAAIAGFIAGFPSHESYESYLDNHPGGKTELKKRFRYRVLVEQLVSADEAISGDAIAAWYREHPEQFRRPSYLAARGLLVAVPDDASAAQRRAAREEASELRRQVTERDLAFAAFARRHSDHPSALDGGDLRRVTPDSHPELYRALANDEPGAITPVISTAEGYWIAQLVKRVQARRIGLEEAADSIRHSLVLRQRSARIESLMRELRSEAQVHTTFPLDSVSKPSSRSRGRLLVQQITPGKTLPAKHDVPEGEGALSRKERHDPRMTEGNK